MPLDHNTHTQETGRLQKSESLSDATAAEHDRMHLLLGNTAPSGSEQEKGPGKDFYDLQVRFAKNIARVLPTTLDDALLRYTCIYRRLGLPHPVNADNALWREFMSHVHSGEPSAKVAYAMILEHAPAREQTTQCFSYGYDSESHFVELHFANNDPHERGPLSDERMQARIEELKTMFEQIRRNHPDAEKVRGSSWIYNLANYRRLFPPSYTESLGTPDIGFTGMAIWGQFIDRKGGLRSEQAKAFLERVEQGHSKSDLLKAIPLAQRSAEGDIGDFYAFYGIQ